MRSTAKKRSQAQRKAEVVSAFRMMLKGGDPVAAIVTGICETFKVSQSTLYRWRDEAAGIPDCDLLAMIAPKHFGRPSASSIPQDAFDYLKADYLRLEKPNMTDCYRRLQDKAREAGWTVPSKNTFERHIAALPAEVVTLAREGTEALRRMYPAQTRDRSVFHAMEAVNADGHKWDVWVKWPDGSIVRPVMVAFQDCIPA